MAGTNAKAAAAVGALVIAAGAAVPLVASFEGYSSVGYPDPALGAKLPTACWGHTRTAKLNVLYSQEACMRFLAQDVIEHAVEIMPCIKVEVPSKTLSAFVSFSFNVGSQAFCTSTLARKMNAGDLRGACDELPRWTYAGGKQLAGLVRRRAEERAWCLEGLQKAART